MDTVQKWASRESLKTLSNYHGNSKGNQAKLYTMSCWSPIAVDWGESDIDETALPLTSRGRKRQRSHSPGVISIESPRKAAVECYASAVYISLSSRTSPPIRWNARRKQWVGWGAAWPPECLHACSRDLFIEVTQGTNCFVIQQGTGYLKSGKEHMKLILDEDQVKELVYRGRSTGCLRECSKSEE